MEFENLLRGLAGRGQELIITGDFNLIMQRYCGGQATRQNECYMIDSSLILTCFNTRCRASESLDGALRKLDSSTNKHNINYTVA